MTSLKLPEGVTYLQAHTAVVAREIMSETAFGQFCRKHGYLASTVDAWAEWFNNHPDAVDKKLHDAQMSAMSELKKENARKDREIARKDKALADAATMLMLSKKAEAIWGGGKGKLISAHDRQEIVSLVELGQSKGLSQRQSCEAVGITPRTLQNWRHAPDGDGRLDRSNFTSPRQIPEDLREQIVDRFCKADVRDLSLTQAFYKLLDENKEYWCSLNALPSRQGTGIECTPCAYPGSPPAQQADCLQRTEAKRGVDLGHHLSALEQVHGQVLLRVCHCRRLQPHGCERQGIRG